MQAASIPPWIWLAAGVALGGFVGLVVGYATGRGRRGIRYDRPIVFTKAETPIVFAAEDLRRLDADQVIEALAPRARRTNN